MIKVNDKKNLGSIIQSFTEIFSILKNFDATNVDRINQDGWPLIVGHLRQYYDFCLKLGGRIVPDNTAGLAGLTIYPSYREPLLKNLTLTPANTSDSFIEYLQRAFVEYFCIYTEMRKNGVDFEDLNILYQEIDSELWDGIPEVLLAISSFRGLLNNKYDESKGIDTLKQLRIEADELRGQISGSKLLLASERMTESWGLRINALNIPISRLKLLCGFFAVSSITWPFLSYFFGLTKKVLIVLSGSMPDVANALISIFPYISAYTLVQVMLIYFFRVCRFELTKISNLKNLMEHRKAASEFMASYVDYLLLKGISPVNALSKIDDLQFSTKKIEVKDFGIQPFDFLLNNRKDSERA